MYNIILIGNQFLKQEKTGKTLTSLQTHPLLSNHITAGRAAGLISSGDVQETSMDMDSTRFTRNQVQMISNPNSDVTYSVREAR